MGKPTGFLEYARIAEPIAPVADRIGHYREFVAALKNEDAMTQSARCIDCGVPFCIDRCPIHNIVPDWNDLVYRGAWREALDILHSTNNFPEFTGRICPALCEAACTLNINSDAVGIKSIERFIIDKAWEEGWVVPQPAAVMTGKKVAVIGSGPAGLACAQQLARAGHAVAVFEKNSRIGGLLRYGVPDFKLNKALIDRRIRQMEAEGIVFRAGVLVGALPEGGINNDSKVMIMPDRMLSSFDAIILASGAEVARDLPVPGRELGGIHRALDFLIAQNKEVAGDGPSAIQAKGKRVVVIGGGDTGADCVGTANRHGAAKVTQLELMPPYEERTTQDWPDGPLKGGTTTSHEEGCEQDFAVSTKEFIGNSGGQVRALKAVRVDWTNGKPSEIPGSGFEIQADLVFLAMGFVRPTSTLLEAFGVAIDERGYAKTTAKKDETVAAYATQVDKVFVAGDVRRGQSLVVWAIREGRECARAVDTFLMGNSQ